jgi:ABC-type uncharacterized transport system substrate-binding protein
MLQRRRFITLLGGAVSWPLAARAQQEVPFVGVLSNISLAWRGFYEGLGQVGFVPGRNVAFHYQLGEGQYEQLPAMIADLIGRKVNVIVAFGSTEAGVAKRATATIPIVFESGDPIAEGLVSNLARPEANLTGVSLMDAELMPKRLQLLSELVPAARRFVLLVNPNSAASADVIRNPQDAARRSGIDLHILRASTFDELDAAFQALAQQHAGGLIVDPDGFFNYGGSARVVGPASSYAVPAIYGRTDIAWSGGLISYGPALAASRRQIGILTGRILEGEKPADLPVEQPSRFELVINLKTARALGLTVPPSLLARADDVIE